MPHSPVRKMVQRFFVWSERRTNIDTRYVIKGGSWLTLIQGISAISALITGILFANLIPKETYGMYKYLLSIGGILGAFSLGGLATAIVQSVARGYEGIFRHSVRLNLWWNLPLFIGASLGGAYYFYKGNEVLGGSLLLMALLMPVANSTSMYGAYLNGIKNYRATFFFQSVRILIPALAVAITLFLTDDVLPLIAAFLLSTASVNVLLHWLVIRLYPPNEKVDESSLSYAKHLSVMGIFSAISSRLDGLIIFQMLGPAPLALYAFTVAIPDQIIGFSKNIHILALPKFSEYSPEVIRGQFLKKVGILSALGIFLAGAYSVSAPFIFSILFPAYTDAIPYTQLFSINIVLALASQLFGTYLDSRVESRIKYFVVVSQNTLKVVLMLALIVPFGLTGVIVGEIITRIYSILLHAWIVFRR